MYLIYIIYDVGYRCTLCVGLVTVSNICMAVMPLNHLFLSLFYFCHKYTDIFPPNCKKKNPLGDYLLHVLK